MIEEINFIIYNLVGDEANLGESITDLYSNWLPLSGEEPRDFSLFLQRVKMALTICITDIETQVNGQR